MFLENVRNVLHCFRVRFFTIRIWDGSVLVEVLFLFLVLPVLDGVRNEWLHNTFLFQFDHLTAVPAVTRYITVLANAGGGRGGEE